MTRKLVRVNLPKSLACFSSLFPTVRRPARQHITRMTWYLVDKREYLARGREVGAVFREVIGGYQAAMSAVQVSALIEDRAKVEIEATAVIPRGEA